MSLDPRAHLVATWVDDTRPYYAAMDVLALPSHREGFPYAILEASAMELPVVATRVPGCVDAVVDGVTGTLVPAFDALALADAIAGYMEDPQLRRTTALPAASELSGSSVSRKSGTPSSPSIAGSSSG